ncbi:MAG: immunity protein 39 [Planctomycetales bacterium]|nr:immunity protein 39 [Planctomycetales bacterium]
MNERLVACNWLDSAPFGLVSLVLRFGDAHPDTQIASINKTHSELPVSRELSMAECIDRARNKTLLQYFRTETVIALTDVATLYDLSMDWSVA